MASKKLKLTSEEVKHVAQLAKLELTPKELKKFQSQLLQVLNYVSQLQKIETVKTKPTSQVTGLENVFRLDEIKPSLRQKEVLLGAKETKNNFFKIKTILE